jgi:hypothetical protein
MPTRRIFLAAAGFTAALFVLMLALDQADEDSTLGTLADWTWFAFMISALVLVLVGVLALVGRVRAAKA